MLFDKKFFSFLKLTSFILTSFFLSACSNTSIKPTPKELALIDNPPKQTLTKINALIPHAMRWYDEVEKSLYSKGRVLTRAEKKQAKQLGVKNPDIIRVVVLDKFPEPNKQASNDDLESARTIGNIILIKTKHKDNSLIICHELVHVAQSDRLGLKQFLQRYAIEHEVLGYSRSLLEKEAYTRQQVIQ